MSQFLTEVENCIPALRRYAHALAYDSMEADELVQDCLERALRKRFLWKPTSSVRAWLFTMLHNINANKVRKFKRQPVVSSLEDDIDKTLHPIDSDMGIRDIKTCLRQLPEQQQHILLLVALEGMSYKEVGKILNIPVGTVMSRLSRAREALRTIMTAAQTPRLRRVK